MASKKITEGYAILEDFDNLIKNSPPPPCSCSTAALRRVVWAFKIVDIIRLGHRFRDPVIVAVEYRLQGSRLFMVTSRQHVFHYLCYLRTHRPQYQTWHEIFSGLTPLRLYFDLDFYYETNPNVNVSLLLTKFCRLVQRVLADHFEWRNGEEQEFVRFVNLDATTEEKFSRHIIVHIEKAVSADGVEIVFKNAIEILEFVRDKMIPILKREQFYVQPKAGIRSDGPDGVPLVDMSVYGDKAGQNFRLLGSPKFGRNNIFRLVHSLQSDRSLHEFQFHDPSCSICNQIFLDGLVTASTMVQKRRSDGIVDQQLMSAKNLEIYRWQISQVDMDPNEFGIRTAFYCEINQFGQMKKLFYNKIQKDLLNNLVEASERSEYYESLPDNREIAWNVGLFQNLKSIMSIDPVDWDEVYSIAADLLDAFKIRQDEDDDAVDNEELVNLNYIDPMTLRRLRILYTKFSKWREVSKANFVVQDFGRAKTMYDSYIQVLKNNKNTVIPQDFPAILTRDNFPYVYNLLENVEQSEMERRKLKKDIGDRKRILKLEKMRRSLMEEEKRYQEKFALNVEQGSSRMGKEGLDHAMLHSEHLIEDYKKRITSWDVTGNNLTAGAVGYAGE